MQCLGPGRSEFVGAQEDVLNFRPRFAEFHHRLPHPVERVVDLLVPSAHLRAALVPPARISEVSEVEVTLGQIERRTRILGVAFHFGQQQVPVAGVFQRVEVASTQAPRIQVVVAQ